MNHLRSDIETRGGSPPDRATAEWASRQHGVIAYRQLRALGLEPGAIKHRVAAGRLHRLHVGVYAVGHRLLTANGHRMAAVLACGPDAVLSHRSAASLHALRQTPERRSTSPCRGPAPAAASASTCIASSASTPTTARRRRHPDDHRRPHPARPRGAHRPASSKTRSTKRSDAASSTCPPSKRWAGRHSSGAPSNHRRDPQRAGGAFLRFCDTWNIPAPQTNVLVDGFVVDALWREQKLVVELDGYAFHGTTRTAFERDRVRDADLQRAGYRVLRLTWRRLHEEPEPVAATLHALLASIAAPWRTP